ncbi:MAG: long chain fatty acid CoA ligase [Firmicutes bacterium]|nr:long chain fatty acid CoA ligase [Bacillota bacterium]
MTAQPLFVRAAAAADRVAVTAPDGVFHYRDLLDASATAASRLLAGAPDLREARVAFLVPPGFAYVAVQWGIWRAGGVAVPLAVSHPQAELAYVVGDSGASVIIAHPELADRVAPIADAGGLRLILTTDVLVPAGADDPAAPDAAPDAAPGGAPALPALDAERRAMILYTSGTTSRPKGVVTTHGNLAAQVSTLVAAWGWEPSDHILLILPLHHVHGIINVLTCALWSGAHVTILPRFDADQVWDVIASGQLTLFMAVPTIYTRLITAWEAAPPERQQAMSAGCRTLRLMVSGSAALPVSVLERWRAISGHTLLERYGMTEIGMALSNPLDGPRRPGAVGTPLPGVTVQLVDEEGRAVAPGTPGEIEVRGPSVFQEYWGKPEATRAAFREGWFRTGDIAVAEEGAYRILGRSSVDIIKTGGYKLSALEIEEALLAHPQIAECAVVGIPDPTWGERVGAAVVLRPGAQLTLDTLRHWAADHLAPYKLPTRLLTLTELPRNAMGKVVKPDLVGFFH